MKRILFAAVVLVSVAALADRTDVWSANSVVVYKGELNLLTDGGCSVSAYATITKQDGGQVSEGSRVAEVSGLNRTTCLGLLNPNDGGGFPQLFKQDKGL